MFLGQFFVIVNLIVPRILAQIDPNFEFLIFETSSIQIYKKNLRIRSSLDSCVRSNMSNIGTSRIDFFIKMTLWAPKGPPGPQKGIQGLWRATMGPLSGVPKGPSRGLNVSLQPKGRRGVLKGL